MSVAHQILAGSIKDVVGKVTTLIENNEELTEENEALRGRVEELEKENGTLRHDLDKWKRGFRERRKRRTSRSERKVEGPRRKPGRKPGHVGARRPIPERIDDEVHHACPERCTCGGNVVSTTETRSTIVQDIPPIEVHNTRHTAAVGVCKACKKKVWAPLPGDVEAGRSIAEVQIGPNLQAMAVGLRYDQKTSLGNIAGFFGEWFGVSITRGGVSQIVLRLGEASEPAHKEIQSTVRASYVVGLDETGLRQDGALGWCWVARTERASFFQVSSSRGSEVFEEILGEGFIGVVVSDFYGVYTARDDLMHGYCGAHVIREAKKLAELQPCPETIEFRDRVQAFYAFGAEAQKSGDVLKRRGARIRLGHLISSTDFVAFPDIVRLQERLDIHWDGVTRFLDDERVPWNNNGSERDVRDIARFRVITGGTRSPRGSRGLGIWMSIKQTRRKNGLPFGSFVHRVYIGRIQGTGPPSVFSP